jgi:hypothetical protein
MDPICADAGVARSPPSPHYSGGQFGGADRTCARVALGAGFGPSKTALAVDWLGSIVGTSPRRLRGRARAQPANRARLCLSGKLDGSETLMRVINSVTRAAILTKARRTVSIWALRQNDVLGSETLDQVLGPIAAGADPLFGRRDVGAASARQFAAELCKVVFGARCVQHQAH